jgi:hypothetical protein
MSLIDDFMESSEIDHGSSMALFGDQFNFSNGHSNAYDGGVDTLRVRESKEIHLER